jgi:hypothetical protein
MTIQAQCMPVLVKALKAKAVFNTHFLLSGLPLSFRFGLLFSSKVIDVSNDKYLLSTVIYF